MYIAEDGKISTEHFPNSSQSKWFFPWLCSISAVFGMHSHSHSYVMIIQTFFGIIFTTESQNPVGQNLGGTKSCPQNPIFLQIPSAQNPIFHIIPAAHNYVFHKMHAIGPKSIFHKIPADILSNGIFLPFGILCDWILRPPGFCAQGFYVCRVFVRRDFASYWFLCDGILPTGFWDWASFYHSSKNTYIQKPLPSASKARVCGIVCLDAQRLRE